MFVGTSIVSHWYRPYFGCFLSFGEESSLSFSVSLMDNTRWWAEWEGETLQMFILQCKPLLFYDKQKGMVPPYNSRSVSS